LVLTTPLLAIVLLAGCEGPQGAAGEMGATGPQGPAGDQGPAGQDANENCVQCHGNDTYVLSRQLQYANSAHAQTETFERGGSTGPSYYAGCARCHTNEGFVDYVSGEAAALIENPTPINCRGCHLVHTTGTESDIALRTTDAVTLFNDDEFDSGDGNLCVNCHQPRTPNPLPVIDGPDVTIADHWGPHHGTQGAVFNGSTGFEFVGSRTYPTANDHVGVADACVTCHFTEAWADKAGGHTTSMWDGDEPYTNSCAAAGCHESDSPSTWVDFDRNGVQTAVEALLATLKADLQTIGVLDVDGDEVPGTYAANTVAALYNYFLIEEDGSHGIHNPEYAQSLLTNTIEALP